MTLTPSTVRKQVGNHGRTLDELADRLAVAVRNAHLASQDPASLDTRPRAENATGVKVSGHSDPTGRQALAGIAIHETVFELFESDLEVLQVCVARLTQFAERWAPIVGVRVRCHGGRTVDEWSDPTCSNWADLTPSGNTRGDGLCAACRMRRSRFEQRQKRQDVA